MPLNLTFFGTIDATSVLFLTFVLMFGILIIYLRREDRREGYPLEEESGRLESLEGLLFVAQPKVFLTSDGSGALSKPDYQRESFVGSASRTSGAPGTPLVPRGDPMQSGIGPGAFAQRARRPDTMPHGQPKIVPLRAVPAYQVDEKSPDPRGMQMLGADGEVGGLVTDVWIDRGEFIARYLEVAVTPATGSPPIEAKRVLIPMPLCDVSRSRGSVKTFTVLGSQFVGAPAITGETVTFDEEERASAYFGGGLLYATPARSEPLL